MKKIIIISIVFLSQFVFAQAIEVSGSYDRIGKFINGVAFVHKNGLVGFINAEGKEIVKPEYDKIDYFGSDNIAYTWKNGLVGIIDIKGHVIVDNIYEQIGHFKGNQAVVKKNGLKGVIDRNGRVLIEAKYNELSVEKNGVIRAVNVNGEQVLLKPIKQ